MGTTGRTLNAHGDPVPGTGFELRPESELATILRRRTGALTSHPTQPVWSAPLPEPAGEREVSRSVGIHEPGFEGPPEHYHEQSTEHFELLAGEATFYIDDEPYPVTAGETVTVEPGERHTYTVEGDELCYLIVDIVSPGRLRYVLPTLGGLAHDDDMAVDDLLQQALIARRLDGNTVFTELEPRIARPLSAALAPLGRLRGYRGAYAKYARDRFWERHVEQPAL